MIESKMYDKLQKQLKPYAIKLTRIENLFGCVPDIYFTSNQLKGWIELKNIRYIRKDNTIKVPFRPGQYPWIKNHLYFQKGIYLIVTINNKWFIKENNKIQEIYNLQNIELLDLHMLVHHMYAYLRMFI
ncbi:MAG: hypothetical protein P8Y70_00150 [Candidatus Lokiarchaeota archaeon]